MGPGFFATIFMDVSERKKHEQSLRAKTDELDRFFSLTLDLLCIATLDGRFLRVNAAWTDVLDWTEILLVQGLAIIITSIPITPGSVGVASLVYVGFFTALAGQDFSSIITAVVAAMPLAAPSPPQPPSRLAMFFSSASMVGLPSLVYL